MKPRQTILGLLLAGALAAAFWPQAEQDDQAASVVEPVRKPAASRVTPVQAPVAAGETAPEPVAPSHAGQPLRPRFEAALLADLFPTQNFRPPPPPPTQFKPLPPPPPMAPPLPFGFIGAWSEGGQDSVFLAQGDRTLTAQKGAKLAGGWRLDEIKAGALVFTYEPLNQQRTLRIAP